MKIRGTAVTSFEKSSWSGYKSLSMWFPKKRTNMASEWLSGKGNRESWSFRLRLKGELQIADGYKKVVLVMTLKIYQFFFFLNIGAKIRRYNKYETCTPYYHMLSFLLCFLYFVILYYI